MVNGRGEQRMTDTIELLEAIGRDASLRHAPAQVLSKIVAEAHASDALTKTVASGDSSWLSAEFGQRPVYITQISQISAYGNDEAD